VYDSYGGQYLNDSYQASCPPPPEKIHVTSPLSEKILKVREFWLMFMFNRIKNCLCLIELKICLGSGSKIVLCDNSLNEIINVIHLTTNALVFLDIFCSFLTQT